MKPPQPSNQSKRDATPSRRLLLWSALLVLGVLVLYGRVWHFDFINYDDPDYVTQNHIIQKGVTLRGLEWAFFNLHGDHTYWHPLTWVSHMMDCQLFRLNPGGHHLGNVLFHAANSVLLLWLLFNWTGFPWRSLAVAALFAFHPLQVDTVAWITERKNVLSTFFWLLTLFAYVRYVRKPALKTYCLPLLLFALGLLCKPALVTIPFVLLLLDFWPLQRFEFARQKGVTSAAQPGQQCHIPPLTRPLRWLLLEKLPFLILSCAASWIILAGHHAIGASNNNALPLSWRLANALVSYARYLGKTFWPTDLAIFYPHPGLWSPGAIALSALLLLVLTGLCFWQTRSRPWLLFGWLWFLGTLVPMIGIVQAGLQAMADRFAYVPLIGLFIPIVWGTAEVAARLRLPVSALACLGVTSTAACALVSSHQLGFWRDSLAVFTHAVQVTHGNFIAHFSIGNALADKGDFAAAVEHWNEALRLAPGLPEVYARMAAAQAEQGDFAAAILSYRRALELNPNEPGALNNLAWLLATGPDPTLRDGAAAVSLAERACALTGYQRTLMVGTLAAAYAEAARFAEAVSTARKAIALATASGEPELATRNQELLDLYLSAKPFHELLRVTR